MSTPEDQLDAMRRETAALLRETAAIRRDTAVLLAALKLSREVAALQARHGLLEGAPEPAAESGNLS